jgi:drug/metabolite transporter (DMT)-like permease
MDDEARGTASLLLTVVIWGATFALSKPVLRHLAPTELAFLRQAFGLPPLLWLAWRTRTLFLPLRYLLPLSATGMIGFFLFANLGLERASASLGALVQGLAPVLIAVLAVTFLGERPTARVVAGLVVGLAGVALTTGAASPPAGAATGAAGWGARDVVVLLLSSASWAAGSLYGRRARGASPVVSTAAQLACGGVALLVVAALRGEPIAAPWRDATPVSLLALGYLILFGSVVALTAYVWLLRVATPARVGTYAYVVPAVALALGAALGGEPLTPRLFVALAVILAGVALLSSGGTRLKAERVKG